MSPERIYTLHDFEFDLPEELVAQEPAGERGASRLFVLDRASGTHTHSMFSDLPSFLEKGDLLVFNDSRVIPARIYCARASGGAVEFVSATGQSYTEGGAYAAFPLDIGVIAALVARTPPLPCAALTVPGYL